MRKPPPWKMPREVREEESSPTDVDWMISSPEGWAGSSPEAEDKCSQVCDPSAPPAPDAAAAPGGGRRSDTARVDVPGWFAGAGMASVPPATVTSAPAAQAKDSGAIAPDAAARKKPASFLGTALEPHPPKALPEPAPEPEEATGTESSGKEIDEDYGWTDDECTGLTGMEVDEVAFLATRRSRHTSLSRFPRRKRPGSKSFR